MILFFRDILTDLLLYVFARAQQRRSDDEKYPALFKDPEYLARTCML